MEKYEQSDDLTDSRRWRFFARNCCKCQSPFTQPADLAHKPIPQWEVIIISISSKNPVTFFFFFVLPSLLLLLLFKLCTSERKHSRSDSSIENFIISGRAVNKTRRHRSSSAGESRELHFSSKFRSAPLQVAAEIRRDDSCELQEIIGILLFIDRRGPRAGRWFDARPPLRHTALFCCLCTKTRWTLSNAVFTLHMTCLWCDAMTSFLLEWNAESGLHPLLSSPPPRHQITPFWL